MPELSEGEVGTGGEAPEIENKIVLSYVQFGQKNIYSYLVDRSQSADDSGHSWQAQASPELEPESDSDEIWGIFSSQARPANPGGHRQVASSSVETHVAPF